jgi:protein farnesyltransferase subunit beta
LEEIVPGSERIEELSDEELGSDYEDMGTATVEEQANIAYLESVRIPIRDSLVTETSETEDETAQVVLPFLEGNPNDFSLNAFGIPNLQRAKHEPFLREQLGDYPARAAGLDAARPWIVYWALQGLTAMGSDITSYNKKYVTSVQSTLSRCL